MSGCRSRMFRPSPSCIRAISGVRLVFSLCFWRKISTWQCRPQSGGRGSLERPRGISASDSCPLRYRSFPLVGLAALLENGTVSVYTERREMGKNLYASREVRLHPRVSAWCSVIVRPVSREIQQRSSGILDDSLTSSKTVVLRV